MVLKYSACREEKRKIILQNSSVLNYRSNQYKHTLTVQSKQRNSTVYRLLRMKTIRKTKTDSNKFDYDWVNTLNADAVLCGKSISEMASNAT